MLEPAKVPPSDRTPLANSEDMEDYNVTASCKGDTQRDDHPTHFDDTTQWWERKELTGVEEEFKLPSGEVGPFEISEGKWPESNSRNRMLGDFTSFDTLSRRFSSAGRPADAGTKFALLLDDTKDPLTDPEPKMTRTDVCGSTAPDSRLQSLKPAIRR